jgi:hypothetical protein
MTGLFSLRRRQTPPPGFTPPIFLPVLVAYLRYNDAQSPCSGRQNAAAPKMRGAAELKNLKHERISVLLLAFLNPINLRDSVSQIPMHLLLVFVFLGFADFFLSLIFFKLKYSN